MLRLTNVALWPWLALYSLLGALLGVILSRFLPGGVLRERIYVWRPNLATLLGVVVGGITGRFLSSPVAVVPVALLIAYLCSRLPEIPSLEYFQRLPAKYFARWIVFPFSAEESNPTTNTNEAPVERMIFRDDWNIRPRFETGEEGLFVGREELLGRLSSHFISQGGGTILISGVRGVGKTALVDRALVDARQKLRDRYWEEVSEFLRDRSGVWHPIVFLVRRTLLKLGETAKVPEGEPSKPLNAPGEKLKRGADAYVSRPARRFWKNLNPVGQRIRKMHEASNWQLFVLKFSASDISGAMAEPGQKTIGKPRIDPEKLLRSVIRKLYMTCHSSRHEVEAEARILKWSLFDRAKRQRFFETLEDAYNKSVTKSYTEIISNKVNDFIKQSHSVVSERKINLERFIGLIVAIGFYLGAQWAGTRLNWSTLSSQIIGTGAGGVVAYLTWTWTSKRSRETGSDRSREAQFSYEYDYSLERMQRDLESLLRTLQRFEISRIKFHPLRCFTRSAVIFDELDKLDDADKQLDDVITHFKNFFTLSDTVFVFLTDHQFYEHLSRETTKAQIDRHYSPQHTFFTEKIYLRKPEFSRFREAFYRFAYPEWLVQRASSADAPADISLTEYLLNKGQEAVGQSLPLETLTHLYIHRGQYEPQQREEIEQEFNRREGRKDALALARIWASQASTDVDPKELEKTKEEFRYIEGWLNAEAVSFLFFCKDDIPGEEQTITQNYERLDKPALTKYSSVSEVQFSLSDLARALCFQTRNHYFDLYHMVYDYVGFYADGAPILFLEEKRFAQETRLWSRYQQLLEIAFDSVKENHPSREYFNGLVMESLYRVFDKRAVRESVAIADILFGSNEVAKASRTPGAARKAAKTELPTFTGRDVEKINRAILRLLHLALAHKAISSNSPNFEALLKQERVDWHALAEYKFEWNDDVQSIIKVIHREKHEHELIRFWSENRSELDALDIELARLWNNAAMSEESARMRRVIGELRSKAESVRLKSVKISPSDASAVKNNVGTAETRNAIMPRIILDRIRAEDDADIIEDLGNTATDVSVPADLESRKRQFESATGLRPHSAICPRDTDLMIYLTSSAVPAGFDGKWSKPIVENDYLFWYTSANDEFPVSEKVRFYYSPPRERSAGALFDDYCYLATDARLRRIVAHLEVADYKDSGLAQRAGAEVIGPIGSGSVLQAIVSLPAVELAISLLDKAKQDFNQQGFTAWETYGPDPPKSVDEANAKLSAKIVTNIDTARLPFNLELAIKDALEQSLGADMSRLKPDTWLKVFTSGTSKTNTLARFLLGGVINQIMLLRLEAFPENDKLQKTVLQDFVPWLVQAIVGLAENKGKGLKQMLSSPDWASELEKQRRSLRSDPLPPVLLSPRLSYRLGRRTKK